MRKTILISATFIAAVAAFPAAAQSVVASRPVSHADLDLGIRAGRAQLDRRIAVAVEAICGSYAGAPSSETVAIDRCRASTRTGIQGQLAALQSRSTRLALGSH
jgi:UrcA family protein